MQTVPRHLHPNFVVLPPPIRVSPLIRFARWSALGLGIVWGYVRLQQISRYHADIRDHEHEMALHHYHENQKMKTIKTRLDMITIMELANLPFEEGVKSLGCQDLFKYELKIIDDAKRNAGITTSAPVVVETKSKKH